MPTARHRAVLKLLAFGSGFAVMVLEIAGARLMAPVFGLSAVPWTAIIGVILAALAWGSHLGGKWADEGRIPLASVLLGAAVLAVLPLIAAGFPARALVTLGFIPGAMASSLIFFAPPVLALGTVVPYLVKADTESIDTVGRKAGDMSALATAGSIAGTFMTGFVFLPLFPLPLLIGVTAASIAGLAGLAAWALGSGPPKATIGVSAIVLAGLGIGGTPEMNGLLHREESVYSSIAVTEREWSDGRLVRELWQNGGSSSAEYVDTGLPAHVYAEVASLLLTQTSSPIESALVLGGAALSLPVAFRRWQPEMSIDVVELDPAVTRLAAEYFAYGEYVDDPAFRIYHSDARLFLDQSDESWDLILLDVFDHLLTVPWPMITVEALELYRERLNDDGLLLVNMLTPLEGPGLELLERFVSTGSQVFPEVRAYPVRPELDPQVTQNVLLLMSTRASAQPVTQWPPLTEIATGTVLTDDFAPVEFLQAKLLLRGLGW